MPAAQARLEVHGGRPSSKDNVQRNKRILFAVALAITLGFLGFVAWAVLAR